MVAESNDSEMRRRRGQLARQPLSETFGSDTEWRERARRVARRLNINASTTSSQEAQEDLDVFEQEGGE